MVVGQQYREHPGFFSGSLDPTHWMKTTVSGFFPEIIISSLDSLSISSSF
jgi:hypothetical protein